MKKTSVNFKFSIIAVALGLSTQAEAIPVDLELSLLVDVSGSVDGAEFNLQRDAYVAAFTGGGPIISAIQSGALGSIAINYIYWSGAGQQEQSVGWTQVSDTATGNAFAASILAATRPFGGLTAPGSVLNFAVPLFTNNFEGTRAVIDVSGDGAQNDGANTAAARDAALAAGIDAINGVVIGGDASVLNFYVNNIQGGPGAFTLTADNFTDFSDAINDKLIREIRPMPEPATLLLGLLGFGALVIAMRRRESAGIV